jgi:hypothetical protein
MFIHAMEFLKQHTSLRKSLLEHYFISLLKIYQMKTCRAMWIISNKNSKTQKKTIHSTSDK